MAICTTHYILLLDFEYRKILAAVQLRQDLKLGVGTNFGKILNFMELVKYSFKFNANIEQPIILDVRIWKLNVVRGLSIGFKATLLSS